MSTFTVRPQAEGDANCHSCVLGAAELQPAHAFALHGGLLLREYEQYPVCGWLDQIAQQWPADPTVVQFLPTPPHGLQYRQA